MWAMIKPEEEPFLPVGMRRKDMPHAVAVLLMAVLVVTLPPIKAYAGHELPYYPSYYPQEIRIEAVDPGSAAALLQKSVIQAYIGPDPFPGGKIPDGVGAAASFGSYLVLTFNPASAAVPDQERRCTAAAQILSYFDGVHATFRHHPYPVTPYHMDYLYHFDALQAARQAYR